MTVLYITQNGITDHIGRSQVAPYVLGLARRGYKLHVLSAEKPGRDRLEAKYAEELATAGVEWSRVRYRNAPRVAGPLLTHYAMMRRAREVARRHRITFVHCRSHPAAHIGYDLFQRFGIPYIFDFRDFYADSGLDKAHGLARLAFAQVRRQEGPMLRNAAGVVCLTERAIEVLLGRYFDWAPAARGKFRVIPCCADFSLFDRGRLTAAQIAEARTRAGLTPDDDVMLYLGSLGPDYLLDQMLALFRQFKLVSKHAKFLFVCNNGRNLVDAACLRLGVAETDVRFVTAERDDIPAFLSLARLSVIFIRPDLAKAGCSPTKLAEALACDVPVVANTGFGDIDRILHFDRNRSIVIPNFSDETLRDALRRIIDDKDRPPGAIRAASGEYNIAEGVCRYSAIYDELLSRRSANLASC